MKTIRWLLVAACAIVLTGCAGSNGKSAKPTPNSSPSQQVESKPVPLRNKPARRMRVDPAPPTDPPPGKSLVCIHRPDSSQVRTATTGVWDSDKLVGALMRGHSLAYVCEPGHHYFFVDSAGNYGALEAQLLPDQTYDLWVDPFHGFWYPLQLKPLTKAQKEKHQVAEWTRKNLWITRDTTAEAYELKYREQTKVLLERFVSGNWHKRLEHLAPEHHR